MEIINLEFEKSLVFCINKQPVTLTVFRTPEHGNVKLGVDAPRDVSLNREEIFLQKQRRKVTELMEE